MNFKNFTSRATATCITLADIAEACGVADNSIRRARLDPTTEAYRNPPPEWEKAVAKLARERAGDLVKLAEELEGP